MSLAPPLPQSQSPPGMREVGSRHICHPQRYSEEFDKTIHQLLVCFTRFYCVSVTQMCIKNGATSSKGVFQGF